MGGTQEGQGRLTVLSIIATGGANMASSAYLIMAVEVLNGIKAMRAVSEAWHAVAGGTNARRWFHNGDLNGAAIVKLAVGSAVAEHSS